MKVKNIVPTVQVLPVVTDAKEVKRNEEQVIRQLARAARTSYQSEPKGKPGSQEQVEQDYKLVKHLLHVVKHLSVFEHVVVSVRVTCSRGCSHEWVRHRHTAFTQESTRYCNYTAVKHDSALRVVIPDVERNARPVIVNTVYDSAVQAAADAYEELIRQGVPPEHARGVLPLCTATRLYVTASIRQWRSMLELRAGLVENNRPHPEIKAAAREIIHQMHHYYPTLFADLQDRCMLNV